MGTSTEDITEADKKDHLAKLMQLRERDDLRLKPTKYLSESFTGHDGEEIPFALRPYQVLGCILLVSMNRFLLGDATGLGKTLQSIAALCYIWADDPSRKVVVLTTKSVAPQWKDEFAKFTTGVRVILAVGTPKMRKKAYEVWRRGTEPSVLITGYASIDRDLRNIQNDEGYILIADEATAFKNPKTKRYQTVSYLASKADRFWALTATLIRNNLLEGRSIYSILVPGLFGTENRFKDEFCITQLVSVPGGRHVQKVVGYQEGKVDAFREKILPYYLGRAKSQVAQDLPALTRKVVYVEMSKAQKEKYKESLEGLLTVGQGRVSHTTVDGVEEDTSNQKETTKLTALLYCQQISNHLSLIDCEGGSTKLDALIEMLTEGDLKDQKVIVFTRFKKMVNVMMPALKKAGLAPVRITGDEHKTSQRQASQRVFQDPDSPCKVICITSAGGEGINLQTASAIVFYDTPWSAGELLQIIGRMIRIGSKHDNVLAIHLASSSGLGKTIDKHVISVVNKKTALLEQVLGARLQGKTEGFNELTTPSKGAINDIFDALREEAFQAVKK